MLILAPSANCGGTRAWDQRSEQLAGTWARNLGIGPDEPFTDENTSRARTPPST